MRRILGTTLALALFALPTAAAASGSDALTIYTPTATYTWAGDALGIEAAAGTNGAAGFVLFDTLNAPPIIDGPRRFAASAKRAAWTAELAHEQQTVTNCTLHELAYLAESGVHVILRCDGPPQ